MKVWWAPNTDFACENAYLPEANSLSEFPLKFLFLKQIFQNTEAYYYFE